ncbi:hypothetical protein BSKO_01556 [Bryopsis sp. KO-2023]|nr:hypothetical protein BSKO_01556 [Bryopsis sp. KO-2023]
MSSIRGWAALKQEQFLGSTRPPAPDVNRTSGAVCCQSGRRAVETSGVPERLALDYFAVQNPVSASTTYSKAVKDFTSSAVLAYECGYCEDGLRRMISEYVDADADVSICSSACLELSSIVWITLMLAPSSSVRWAVGEAVSEVTLREWKGFVSLIVDAYFNKRMSWYPVDRLQAEMSLSTGRCEELALVAERARIVYTTLEAVAPQFPTD